MQVAAAIYEHARLSSHDPDVDVSGSPLRWAPLREPRYVGVTV